MENKKIVVLKKQKEETLKDYAIFRWELEKENDLQNGKIELFLTRNIEEKYVQQMNVLEDEFFPHIHSTFLLILPTILSFCFFTLFLVLFLINKADESATFETTKWVLICFIPGGLLLAFGSLLSFQNTSRMEKFVNNKKELSQKAINDVKKILGE
mgnify:FL=1